MNTSPPPSAFAAASRMELASSKKPAVLGARASEAEGRRSPAPGLRREGSGLSALRLSTSLHTSRELESRLAESYSGWHVKDIDWRFVLSAQHYGTAITTLAILIALIVVHWTLPATKRVFFVYDTSISYISHGDTIPGWVTVVVPMICLLLSLVSYECFIYRSFNVHPTNAMATILHFSLDCVCTFVTVEFVTELTKLLAGRLRPAFLQDCFNGDAQLLLSFKAHTPVVLGNNVDDHIQCIGDTNNVRKSFPSGHSSVTSAIMVYNIVYLLWAGYLRADGASFLGLRRQTGWRGGRRLFRELGHGIYLLWILCQFAFIWAVGVSRFNDNKHHISDIIGGWLLGTTFALIYAIRAMTLHQYVILHALELDTRNDAHSEQV